MRDFLQSTWRQIFTLTSGVLFSQGAEDQKRFSWARRLESYAAVPSAYSAFFEPLRAEGRVFPYTVLTPTFEGFLRGTTEKLVCDLDREIVVLENRGNTVEAQRYPLETISCIEVSTVLLESYIKIQGMTRDGRPAASRFKFNSVTDHLFFPILEKIRLAAVASAHAAPNPALEGFICWNRQNYKFMNYAQRSLLAGEKALYAILQPEFCAYVVKVLGMSFCRRRSPTQAVILTDREIIVIREEEKTRADAKYSGIWDYFPLSRVLSLSQAGTSDGVQTLSIHLPEGDSFEILFQATASQEIATFVEQFDSLTRD